VSGEAAGIQNHQITNVGKNLWLGRESFAELGWHTRETAVIPVAIIPVDAHIVL